ncbi:hypothetical protein EC973_000439 [Apophysomyces ossiformis]|uniref:Uncharacterized protein n=1 Tax=Apophysomyces ossiformis TaxID=679940 RepID=A0A8H7EQ16_9FUNG|nr:hypothetical protein EC973_000439 [Apophysomyces ossiformis]
MLSPQSEDAIDTHKLYDDAPATIEPDIDSVGQSISQQNQSLPQNFTPPATPDTPNVTGTIGSEQSPQHLESSFQDTLDEPVSTTIVSGAIPA